MVSAGMAWAFTRYGSEAFRDAGAARFAPPANAVAFAAQIRDPDNHRLTTPPGKIEVYSTVLAAKPDFYGLGIIPPIPTGFDPVEPQSKYPLMLCSPKSRTRAHSIHGNQPQLARVDPDDVWMDVEDARARGGAADQGHGPHRAGRGLDQGRRLVHAGRRGCRQGRLRQCADERPVCAVWATTYSTNLVEVEAVA
jgi:hypothetical protein